MKQYDVCGIANAIVDILLDVDDARFNSLGIERGTMRLVDVAEQQSLIERFSDRDLSLVSGGSVANSIIALSELGGKGALLSCIGDDRYGLHYREECERLGIALPNPSLVGETTGTSVVMITPDAERTMRTNLAVSAKMSPNFVDEDTIKRSRWLFLEGYLFSNPEGGQQAIKRAIELARKHDTKIAITFSEAFVVEVFGDSLREAVTHADLVFANESEASAYTKELDILKSFEKLCKEIPSVVVTGGAKGAYISHGGRSIHTPAFPCEPRDLTGAGDMLAGSILYGLNHGFDLVDIGKGACYLAREVIMRIGPRLQGDVRALWDDALRQ